MNTTVKNSVSPFWVTFEGRSPCCVEAENADAALELAKQKTGTQPAKAERLPYPARPRLNVHLFEMTDGTRSPCPAFCFQPEKCVGLTCCPRPRACDD